jgi:hypothetical protein
MCLRAPASARRARHARSLERALDGRARSLPRARSARQKATTGGRRSDARHAWLGAACWLDARALTSTSTFRVQARTGAAVGSLLGTPDSVHSLSWAESVLSASVRGGLGASSLMDAKCDALARTFHAPQPSPHRQILARFVVRFRDRDARAERALDGGARSPLRAGSTRPGAGGLRISARHV